MDNIIILLRTFLMYGVIYLVMRMMGKREIGKLSVFDLVIFIMIAESAVLVIEDTKRPLMEGVIPIITLASVQILFAYITLKNQTFRTWFDGKPSVIIDKGIINRDEMKRQRYNLDDLLLQLREKKVTNVADVEFAILETSGKLNVITKNDQKNQDLQEEEISKPTDYLKIRYEGLPLPLIMDGKVQDDNLTKIGKNRFWLKREIKNKGISDFKNIFYCSIDHKGKLYMDIR